MNEFTTVTIKSTKEIVGGDNGMGMGRSLTCINITHCPGSGDSGCGSVGRICF